MGRRQAAIDLIAALSAFNGVSGMPGAQVPKAADDAILFPPIYFEGASRGFTASVSSTEPGPAIEFYPFTPDMLNSSITDIPGFNPTEDIYALDSRDVLGADDRTLVTSRQYPYTAVGRITRSDGWACSAALIGPRHIATARHCLLPYKNKDPEWIRVAPSYYDTARLGTANVISKFYIDTDKQANSGGDSCYFRDDWAVAVLDQRMGDTIGFFGGKDLTTSGLSSFRFSHVGYPSDKQPALRRPYYQNPIKGLAFNCDSNGPVNTDADIVPGHSGGPLWQAEAVSGGTSYYLYGMSSGYGPTISLFAGMKPWMSALVQAKKVFP